MASQQQYAQNQLKILAVAMAKQLLSKGEKVSACTVCKSMETGVTLIFARKDIGDALVKHLETLGPTQKDSFGMEKPA